jgi:hypothetical protein
LHLYGSPESDPSIPGWFEKLNFCIILRAKS